MTRVFSIAARAALLLCVVAPVVAQHTAWYSRTDAPREWSRELGRRWMSCLDDARVLSEVSIPGTHDTGTRNGGGLGMAQCQSWTLRDQLEAGIRWVDIRCRHDRDAFRIFHGPVDQKLSFDADVRDVVLDFLEDNPTETVVMVVKCEGRGRNSRSFAATLDSYLRPEAERFYTKTAVPKLGAVRGKVVLFDRTPKRGRDGKTYGIPWSVPRRQDAFNLAKISIRQKLDRIEDHFRTAIDGASSTWFVNHTSAANTDARALLEPPRAVAARINPRVFELVRELGRRRIGTVVMDFPGEQLIHAIIAANPGVPVQPAHEVALYASPGFAADSLWLEVGEYSQLESVADAEAGSSWADEIESVRVPAGLRGTAWSDPGFAGERFGPFLGPVELERVAGAENWESLKVDRPGTHDRSR